MGYAQDSMLVVRIPRQMKEALEARVFKISLGAGVMVTSSDLVRRVLDNYLIHAKGDGETAGPSEADTYLRNHINPET